MGYEKGITRKWLRMVLHGEYPDSIPGFPKTPDTPGRGTPNHQLLAHLARVTWAIEKGNRDRLFAELQWVLIFFGAQRVDGFMSRGNTTEQLSPSHSQWWINGVVGLRWVLLTAKLDKGVLPIARQELLDDISWWLRSHHALCRLFSTPVGIVAPGARAWPFKDIAKTNLPPYSYSYGRSTLRDELYSAIERGRVRKVWDPEKNLDMAAMYFVNELLSLGDDLGGAKDSTSKDLPYLKWPIHYERIGDEFFGWLPDIKGSRGLAVQRFAGWINGKELYGVEDYDPSEQISYMYRKGAVRRMIGETREKK